VRVRLFFLLAAGWSCSRFLLEDNSKDGVRKARVGTLTALTFMLTAHSGRAVAIAAAAVVLIRRERPTIARNVVECKRECRNYLQ
jgi:hypothetical protein